jgi:NAD(P)-dependent dehydrogenase (short-subunit alcohol dehydrogenase family)
MTTPIALVTGAGTGVGKAVSLALLKKGYSVALTGRRQELLQAVIAEAKLPAERTLAIAGDVGDPQSVKQIFARVREVYGRLDLLFNNAGVGAPGVPLEDITFEQWKRVVDTNLTGTFLCTQEAFRIMKAQTPRGGRIINNGSISAQTPRPNSSPYTSTKHAVSGLTKSTSLDGRAFDICCGQIDIGNANTELAAKMAAGIIQPNGTILKEPTIDVNHVAEAVVYMAGLPLDVNVLFMNVMANKMPFVGRG